jgi:hypothetical protein
MSHLTTPRLSNPTRCKCLLQTITSRGIILWVIILKQAVWQRHLIRHWVKYSWRWSQRIEEFTTITSLRIYGHIMLLYAPQRETSHIPCSMGAKLFCFSKCRYPHYGSPFMRKLPMKSKFNSDFKSLIPWKKSPSSCPKSWAISTKHGESLWQASETTNLLERWTCTCS